jgi:hypothetical protein
MSAESTQTTNGRDVHTLEPITHEYDRLNETVLAECTACWTETSRRLLRRDYDLEEDFKQSLAEGDDDYLPCVIYRHCDECGREESHFVC